MSCGVNRLLCARWVVAVVVAGGSDLLVVTWNGEEYVTLHNPILLVSSLKHETIKIHETTKIHETIKIYNFCKHTETVSHTIDRTISLFNFRCYSLEI